MVCTNSPAVVLRWKTSVGFAVSAGPTITAVFRRELFKCLQLFPPVCYNLQCNVEGLAFLLAVGQHRTDDHPSSINISSFLFFSPVTSYKCGGTSFHPRSSSELHVVQIHTNTHQAAHTAPAVLHKHNKYPFAFRTPVGLPLFKVYGVTPCWYVSEIFPASACQCR